MLQEMKREQQLRKCALERIEQPCAAIKYQALQEQTVKQHGKRRDDAELSNPPGPAEIRPVGIKQFFRFQTHVAILRCDPVRQGFAVIVINHSGQGSDLSINFDALCMSVLGVHSTFTAEQDSDRGIDRRAKRASFDAVPERGPISGDIGLGGD